MCPTDESVFLTRVTGPAGSYPSTHWACGRITQIIHINNNEFRIIWLSPGIFLFLNIFFKLNRETLKSGDGVYCSTNNTESAAGLHNQPNKIS